MPARPSPFLLAAIGSALLVGLVGVIAVGLTYGHPRVNVVVLGWVTVTYSVSGLVAWRCRPANRIGPLMVLTGAGTLVSAMGRAEQGVVHTVGQALDLVPLVMIVHVFLTFPTGRLTGRAEKALIYTGYLAAVPGQITVMLLGGLQPHLLTVAETPGLATFLYNVVLSTVSAVALGGVALLVVRRRTHGRQRDGGATAGRLTR